MFSEKCIKIHVYHISQIMREIKESYKGFAFSDKMEENNLDVDGKCKRTQLYN